MDNYEKKTALRRRIRKRKKSNYRLGSCVVVPIYVKVVSIRENKSFVLKKLSFYIGKQKFSA